VRLSSLAVGVMLGIVLLTWLLLRGIGNDGKRYEQALQAFNELAFAEASLHRDVLQARAGLLLNYDAFSASEAAMKNAVTQLRSLAQTEGLNSGPVDRLASSVVKQVELTEQFKSSNALLQNSLSYVGLLSTDPTFGDQDVQLMRAADALAAAILHLTRDTSPEAIQALEGRIEQFAPQAPTVGPDAEATQALLAHARLLSQVLPAVDRTLEALVFMPNRQSFDETRALFSSRRAAVEATAWRFRLLLYLASLLLLVALVRLGLRLRARALDPERFDKYYREVHGPMTSKLPGLKGYKYGPGRALDGGPGEFFWYWSGIFDSRQAALDAMASPEGLAGAADVPNYYHEDPIFIFFEM
jgi:uncharacterized protein (TIGR02118 family)